MPAKDQNIPYVVVDEDWEPTDEPMYEGTLEQIKEAVWKDWVEYGGFNGLKLITREQWDKDVESELKPLIP